MDATKRTQWLASGVLVVTALALAGLLGRVVWIQKHVTGEERERLARQYTAEIPIMPDRGAILFADGTPAALSVRMYNLFADPGYILNAGGKLNPLSDAELKEARERLSEALGPLMEKPAEEVLAEITDHEFYQKRDPSGMLEATARPRRFLWLAKEVDDTFYEKFVALKKEFREESQDATKSAGKLKDPALRAAALAKASVLSHTLDGVGFVKSMKRVYPLGQLGGHVIGFANNYEGVDGMEHQLDFLLRGIPGSMYVTQDASRHTLLIQDQRYSGADDGRDVWLTINTVMQGIVEDELKKAIESKGADGGTAMIMDPFDGKLLAIANYPFFDPTDPKGEALVSARDKAVTDPFEPGSIFKPFIMSFAIEKHIVKPTDVFSGYNGVYHDPTGRTVRDDASYGALTVHDILVKSSNIGMTQIGWKMGTPLVYEAIRTFGFGGRTGVELPGDQKGLVPPLNQWTKGTLTSASFGYGIAATPLQLLRAFATFANGGYLVTPRIIHAVEENSGKTVTWGDVAGPSMQKQILSAATCATMRTIMIDVLGPQGTAKSAGSKIYNLYGKTGTAHIAASGKGGGHGYAASDYNSSFLCGGPVREPRLVVIVTLHKPRHGYFGGTVSAPAAVAIMERALMYQQVPLDWPEGDGGKGTQVAQK
jgi:cell division protein FtsI (penicillin-binding protein 3)